MSRRKVCARDAHSDSSNASLPRDERRDDAAAVASCVSLTTGSAAPVMMSHEVCVMVLRKKTK